MKFSELPINDYIRIVHVFVPLGIGKFSLVFVPGQINAMIVGFLKRMYSNNCYLSAIYHRSERHDAAH